MPLVQSIPLVDEKRPDLQNETEATAAEEEKDDFPVLKLPAVSVCAKFS